MTNDEEGSSIEAAVLREFCRVAGPIAGGVLAFMLCIVASILLFNLWISNLLERMWDFQIM